MLSIALLLALSPTAHAKKDRAYTSVRIDLEGRTGLCAGQSTKLDLFGTDDKGKERKIRFGQWKAFDIAWGIGPVTTKGRLEMPLEPSQSWGKPGVLTVTAVDQPAVTATANLPTRYDCSLRVALAGTEGEAGTNGEEGTAGTESAGGAGQNAGHGGQGGKGPDLTLHVYRTPDPVSGVDVLQVRVTDTTSGESWNNAVAVQGGELIVVSEGGRGGVGGTGGKGGEGEEGYAGGPGGHGGNGGKGGDGGSITVIADPNAADAVPFLTLSVPGGPGGDAGSGGAGGGAEDPGEPGPPGPNGHVGKPGNPGPEPGMRVEPVGPLW